MAPGCGASVKDVLEPSGRVGSVAAVKGKFKRRGGANGPATERPAARPGLFVSPPSADYNGPAATRGDVILRIVREGIT